MEPLAPLPPNRLSLCLAGSKRTFRYMRPPTRFSSPALARTGSLSRHCNSSSVIIFPFSIGHRPILRLDETQLEAAPGSQTAFNDSRIASGEAETVVELFKVSVLPKLNLSHLPS